MASYSLAERFNAPKDCFRILDPAAYDLRKRPSYRQNKYPFLSNAPRKSSFTNKLYTNAIYDADVKYHIQNITSLKSKRPRFSYESFTEEDLRELLCRCGFEIPCECPTEDQDDFICQARVHKRLFKGPPPHSSLTGGLSCPSKRDHGFEILPDGSSRRLFNMPVEQCPPFYDARVHESTEYYRGWKWSKWTSQRAVKSLETRPGPGAYDLKREKTQAELCAEKIKADRRKKSKQPRYIEIIQQRLIREGQPGPADYTPLAPRGTELQYFGPKTERFPAKQEKLPGPATYFIKRTFDPPVPPDRPCHAKLPEPSCFGNKAPRFTYRVPQGPGPAAYNAAVKLCQIQHCSIAPFGVSAIRFKDNVDIDSEEESKLDKDEDQEEKKVCPSFTWQFKSRTSRFVSPKNDSDPIVSKPEDTSAERDLEMQYLAPFHSSQGRFQPWHDWLPVHGSVSTPGPGYYNLEKPKCLPAVYHGPLFRAPRFPGRSIITPAPNEYKVCGGVEDVLATHNKRLLKNINQKHKFKWHHDVAPTEYTAEQREVMLIEKAIKQLEVRPSKSEPIENRQSIDKKASNDEKDEHNNVTKEVGVKNDGKVQQMKTSENIPSQPKEKLLRTFLYKHPQPLYF